MNSLTKFQSLLSQISAPVMQYFNPGLSSAQVSELFSTLPHTPTKQIFELYTWKNGVISGLPDRKVQFGGLGVLTSLQDAIENYDSLFRDEFPNFFPITWDDSLLIHIGEITDETIYLYSPSLLINEPTACYQDLFRMFETFISCFEKKACYYDANGMFSIDVTQIAAISYEMNSNCEYWRQHRC